MLLYNTGFFSTSGKINSVLLVFHCMIVSFSLLSCELNPPLLFVLKHGIYWARAIKCGLTIQHHLVSHTTLCAWPYGKGLQKVHGKYILWKWKNLLMDFKEFFFCTEVNIFVWNILVLPSGNSKLKPLFATFTEYPQCDRHGKCFNAPI